MTARIVAVAALLTLLNAAIADEAKESSPITPDRAITPLGPDGATGGGGRLYTWLKASKHEDPQHAFTVKDGLIHIQGGDHRGYIATKQAYKDYHLSVEYKWGETTDGGKYVRNSGVLLHATGADGSTGGGAWLTSLEVQLAQGCEGDFIVIRGKDKAGEPIKATISSRVRIAEDGKTRWDPDGKLVEYSGRQFWWKDHMPGFKELLDTRGDKDVASPKGEWTKVECICRGDKVTVKINGVTVNEALKVYPSAGRICLQNEGHEVYFRNWQIRPLTTEGTEDTESKKE